VNDGVRRVAVKRLKIIGLCGVGMSLFAGSVWAEDSPFIGRWHWNRAQSTLPAGEAVPADLMADFSRIDSAHVRWSITVVNAQGQPTMKSFDAPANGEFYPISNDTTASFRLIGPALEATFKGPLNQTDTLTCTVAEQKKKMTCNGVVRGLDGKTENYVDVYDRR